MRTDGEQEELIEELVDRYGDPPKAILNLLLVARIRQSAHRVYITDLKQNGQKLIFRLLPTAKLNPAGIPAVVEAYQPWLLFIADKEKPAFELDLTRNKEVSKKAVPEYVQGFLEKLAEETLGAGEA